MTPCYMLLHSIMDCYHSASLSCVVLSYKDNHILLIFNELFKLAQCLTKHLLYNTIDIVSTNICCSAFIFYDRKVSSTR
jgi:hypothetical protein